MKVPLKSTRALPKFDMISLALGEELPKFFKDSCSMDLIWVRLCIEYLLGHIDGVSDDDDFRYVFFVASLIKSTPNCKKFHFSAGDVGVKIVNGGLYFLFSLFTLYFSFSFIFLFLEQLRLGFISHAVT